MGPDTKQDLIQWDLQNVWHAFTQMAEYTPLIIERAHGCTLVDIDGNEYLDGASSLWCNVHGHRHPRLDQAIRDQLDKVAHVTSLGLSNPTTIRLAKRLADLAPGDLNHVFFSDDGATAVEVALKMAFQYWQQRTDPRPQKTQYVALDRAYHGDTLGSVSVGGVSQFHQMFAPLLFKPFRLDAPDTYRLPPGVTAESACDYYLAQLRDLLRERHHEIAAVVIESLVQGAAGLIMQPAGFLKGVRQLTDEYEVLLIADEVAVGIGRTGTMFACEQEGVTPDLLCLAKGLTGGYLPLAATLTHDRIYEAFLGTFAESKSFFHGHTYGGNPLGAAVAIATLDVMEDEQTLAQLPEKIARIGAFLERIRHHPHVGDVRQRGMIAAVELVADRTTKQPYDWTQRRGQQVCDEALRRGVWIRPLGNVVVIMPPLSISLGEIDRLCEAVAHGVDKATALP